MEELIEIHRQAKQEHAHACAKLNNLQTQEKELKAKISRLTNDVMFAKQQISKALTNESLNKARANVETVQRNEADAKTLLNNTELAISELKEKLPALHNDIYLAEQDIWNAQQEQLIREVKEVHMDVLHLIMQAYVAAWQGGYRWEFEHFIREKVFDADFYINPDILAQFKEEMLTQIWPNSDIKNSN